MQDSIGRVSLIKEGRVSREMEFTDNWWLRVIVYNALIGHVEVVRILWPSNTPNWRRYILPMAFRLAIGGSGRDLRRDTH